MSTVTYSGPGPDYCGSGCGGEARKHGRTVRLVTIGGEEMTLCALCEGRAREGLVRYLPSNGTEFNIFEERCERCRHGSEHPEHGMITCAFGIVDRILDAAWEPRDSNKLWHDPQDLTTTAPDGSYACPAICLRFTDRSDPDGARRDPPPKDCVGQLFFSDILTVPERVPRLALR